MSVQSQFWETFEDAMRETCIADMPAHFRGYLEALRTAGLSASEITEIAAAAVNRLNGTDQARSVHAKIRAYLAR